MTHKDVVFGEMNKQTGDTMPTKKKIIEKVKIPSLKEFKKRYNQMSLYFQEEFNEQMSKIQNVLDDLNDLESEISDYNDELNDLYNEVMDEPKHQVLLKEISKNEPSNALYTLQDTCESIERNASVIAKKNFVMDYV